MLLELLRGATSPAPLLGLLRVYKEFNPGIPEEQFASARPMLFKHPDTEWRDQLRSIQERSASASLGIHPHGTSFKVHRNRAQRSRGLIPEVHTFHVEDNMVSLEEIDGPDEFADKFEKIELPSQMISALDDPLLQKYVYLRNDASHASRIDDWLALFFDAQLEAMKNGEHSVKDLGDVLSSLLGYVQYTKVSCSASISVMANNLGTPRASYKFLHQPRRYMGRQRESGGHYGASIVPSSSVL